MNFLEFSLFWLHFQASYYGLMYAIWFLLGYGILLYRWVIKKELLDNLFLYIFVWIVLWGRVGYVLFYNFSYYWEHPGSILKFWEGGMSFHGGMLWVILAMVLFAKKEKINFYKLADQLTLVVPIWLFFGRIWNYINKELLWYSPYNWLFAVEKNGISYFPSPLLEALLEWVILFIILQLVYFYYKKRKNGQIAALFLIFYGIFRVIVEVFFRQPDAHIGYIFNSLTLGTLLSIPMILIGIYYFLRLQKNEN